MDSAYVASYDQWIPGTLSDTCTLATSSALVTASYLTDPLCKSREYFVRSRMLEDLPSASPRIRDFLSFVSNLPFCSFLTEDEYAKWLEFYYLRTAATSLFVVSTFTAPMGIALRAVTGYLSTQPLHYRGRLPEKEREGNHFSHLLRNICGVKSGYDIEEGAQMPIRDDLDYPENYRLTRLIEQIRKHDPDVLCLNEVYDINDAHHIAGALKDQYAHFIFLCGQRSTGPNSGLFFASKFAVSAVQFKAFPKEMLVDNMKQCEKGVLLVDIRDSQGNIATIAVTHAQSSDQVRFGSFAEKRARAEEFKFIQKLLEGKERVVLTGDINMDDDEMKEDQNRDIYSQFIKSTTYINEGEEEFSWGGDEWYVRFGNRTANWPTLPTASKRLEPRAISTGCNLDHTMVSKDTMSVETVLIDDPIPYNPYEISRDSLSDHRGLLSIIKF